MSEKGQGVEVQIGEGMALDETGDEVIVELRSDFNLDSNSQSVDADAVGTTAAPIEGTPGARQE